MNFNNIDRMRHIEIMKDFHNSQYDSLGCPYWLHPYRVALNATEMFHSGKFNLINKNSSADFIFLLALYHDVLEDVDGLGIDEFIKITGINNRQFIHQLVLLTKPKIVFDEKFLIIGAKITDYFNTLEYEIFYTMIGLTYDEYIDRLIKYSLSQFTEEVLLVKYADNLDNSLFWRSKKIGVQNTKYDFSKKILFDALKRERKT